MKLKYFLKEVLSKFGKKQTYSFLRITARKKIKGKRRRSGTSEQGTEFGNSASKCIFLKCLKVAITVYPLNDGLFTIDGLFELYGETVITFLKIATPVLMVVLIAGIGSAYAQVGFLKGFFH